jgi:PAS domain S-box-containing protein
MQSEHPSPESEQQFRTLADAIPQLAWMARADGWIYWYNRRWYEYTGTTHEQMEGWGWESVHAPDTLAEVLKRWRKCIATGEPFDMVFPLRGADGIFRQFLTRVEPLKNSEGRVVRWFGTNTDVDELKRTEEKLRESEERYRGIFEHAGTGIAITDLEGRFQSCNPAYTAMLGYTEEELRALVFADLVDPQDREANLAESRRLLAEDIPSFEIVNRYIRKDGAPLWVHKHISFLRDADGRPVQIIALVTDVTARKLHEEHIRLLMRELNHRAKNMLSVVDAIAHQTAARSPEDFVERFSERVQALSASQDLLVRNEWTGVDLADLVRAEVAHFADLIGSRIAMHGPKLRVNPASAQAIGLALHELATNAGKYGALSTAAGRVAICWAGDGDTFTMNWTEREGPHVSAPAQRGFGTVVMQAMVERSVGGKVDLDYAPSGLTWRLTCPAANALGAEAMATGTIERT